MLATALVLVAASLTQNPPNAIDLKLAERYIQEAHWIAEEDHGVLWGKSLDGPILLVDPTTRAFAASEDVAGLNLKKMGGIYVGALPAEVILANTSTEWQGKKWAMMLWPLPTNRATRARLMMHELWHRIQADIGLPGASARNVHLDTQAGRTWLFLELRALRKALLAEPGQMRPYIEDALTFRAYRQSLFPAAKAEEDRMEVHEGMAEFTGFMLQGTWEPETRLCLSYELPWLENAESLPTSFAYKTGPAYGLLLDLQEKPWRPGLTPASSLTDLLAQRLGYLAPKNLKREAERRARAYDAKTLIAKETKREQERAAKEASYRKLLAEGPVLEFPLVHLNFSYNPYGVFPLGELGTVYPETTIVDDWGKLTVTKGARITPDFKHAFVSAPKNPETTEGDGWKLVLSEGWRLAPGKHKGDFILVRRTEGLSSRTSSTAYAQTLDSLASSRR